MTSSDIASFRRFDRTWTAATGLFRTGLLDSRFSSAEARVIDELAQGDAREVADLRRRLDLDSGYLTRIIARLRAEGVVATGPSPDDGRRQVASLTEAGRRAFAELEARSVARAHLLLGAVPSDRRAAAIAAMNTLTDAVSRESRIGQTDRRRVALRAPEPGDLGWVVSAHGELYAREQGYDGSFEGLVARIVTDHVAAAHPERERTWIATLDGDRVGCIACVEGDAPDEARLRILLVDPTARGHGVGARLVAACVGFAREVGYRRMVLFTVDALASARRLYEAEGFTLTTSTPTREWGVDVVEQTWALDL